jgi:hypothetical protein
MGDSRPVHSTRLSVEHPVKILGGTHGSALLKAFPAKDRAALRGTEGNRSVLSTLRTSSLGLRAHLCGAASTAGACTFSALGFATLATFGFVLETLVGEEHLFSGSKDKLCTTFGTLQDLIVEFHEPLPLAQFGQRGRRTLHQRAGR